MARTGQAFDVGVIIALKEEFGPFAEALGVKLFPLPPSESGDVFYRFEFVDITGASRTGIVTFIGDMGEGDAGSVTERLLSMHSVSLLTVVGLAGLVSDDVKIGQVVVASEADSYMHRGKRTATGMAPGGDPWKTFQPFLKLVDNMDTAHPAVFDRWRQMMEDSRKELLSQETITSLQSLKLLPAYAAIAIGPIVTVPVVGSSLEYKEEVRRRNRNYLAMEMETAGVLRVAQDRKRPPATLVIRGISDPADERKKQVDNYDAGGIRKWAMANAFGFLRLLLRDLPLFTMIEEGEAPPKSREDVIARVIEISEQHLRPEYSILHPQQLQSRANAIAVCAIPPTSVDEIVQMLDSKDAYAIRIDGEWGVGKSTVLEAVYQTMLHRFNDNGKVPVPAYLDVRRYDRIEAQPDGWLAAAKKALFSDLQPLTDLHKHFPDQRIVLIIDGIEEDVTDRDDLEKDLAFWKRKSPQVRRLLGVARRGSTESVLPHIADVKHVIKLTTISLRSADSQILLDAFANLNSVSAEELKKQLEELEIDDLDVTTMMIGVASLNYRGTKYAADVYKTWCTNYLAGYDRNVSLEDAGKLAYRVQFQPSQTQWSELRQNRNWSLTRVHDTVRAFLIASYVSEHLTARAQWSRAKDVLSHVYSFSVNRFCKDLLNSSTTRQREALQLIQKRYAAGPAELKITLAYCAGRLSERALRVEVRRFLRGHLENLLRTLAVQRPSREDLMLLRTLFISLIRLEDRQASSEYIGWMLRNRELDDINRGFHLEYYHDIPYNPEYPRGHYDQPGYSCRRTVSRLVDRVERAINGTSGASVEVEIYTLASLAQFRLRHKKIDHHLRTTVLDILRRSTALVSTPDLTRYLDMLTRHLEAGEFSISHAFRELYTIKTEPRRGWEVRRLTNFETVSTHMYGAYLLALCMLPDATDGQYDKREIMEMLLIHDLTEAYTRDRLPGEKDDDTRAEDDRISGYISMLSTYTDSADLFKTHDRWRTFEQSDTLNAKIARDIDKLENWFQLHVYDQKGMKVDDKAEFAADLAQKVTTEEGKKILSKFRRFFGT